MEAGVAKVAYGQDAGTGETYAFVSDVIEGPGRCQATIPDELAPWAGRTRDAPGFRGNVRLTRPGGMFAVVAASRDVVDAFVDATLRAMLACDVDTSRMIVFEVSTHRGGAPGARAWGRVMDRSVFRRGEVSRVAWSEPPAGEDPDVDALNAAGAPCADPAGKRCVPYTPSAARDLRSCMEALAAASAAVAGFSARHGKG